MRVGVRVSSGAGMKSVFFAAPESGVLDYGKRGRPSIALIELLERRKEE
jgi:hypothetical protein